METKQPYETPVVEEREQLKAITEQQQILSGAKEE